MPRRPPEKAVVAFFGGERHKEMGKKEEGLRKGGSQRAGCQKQGVKSRAKSRRGPHPDNNRQTIGGQLADNWQTDDKQPASPSADRRPAGPVQPKEEMKVPGQQPAKRRVCDINGPTRREIPEKVIRSCRHTRQPVTLSPVHPNAGSTYHPSPFVRLPYRPAILTPGNTYHLSPFRPSALSPNCPNVRQP